MNIASNDEGEEAPTKENADKGAELTEEEPQFGFDDDHRLTIHLPMRNQLPLHRLMMKMMASLIAPN